MEFLDFLRPTSALLLDCNPLPICRPKGAPKGPSRI